MKKIYLTLLILLSACATNYKGDELLDLKGKKSSEVISIMGKPVSERKEIGCRMWAYRRADCSTLVFFNDQGIVQYAEQRGSCTAEVGEK